MNKNFRVTLNVCLLFICISNGLRKMGYLNYCKIKEFSNLVCVSCRGIFHRSCLEGKKYNFYTGYKVYCSNNWEESDKSEKLLNVLEKKEKLLKTRTEAFKK